MARKSTDCPGNRGLRSRLEVEHQDYGEVNLNLLSDDTLRRFCGDANIKYTDDRERNIENLRSKAKKTLSKKTYQSYNKDDDQNEDSKHQEAYVNTFTPINKPKSKLPIMDSDDIGEESRHALPQSPGTHGPPPIIDWTASGISATAIRRECGARVPPIYVPSRLHASEIKSKYGPMLMDLDKERGDANLVRGRRRSLSPRGLNEEMQTHKEKFHVRDYTNAPQRHEAHGNEKEEDEDDDREPFVVESPTLVPEEEQPSESGAR